MRKRTFQVTRKNLLPLDFSYNKVNARYVIDQLVHEHAMIRNTLVNFDFSIYDCPKWNVVEDYTNGKGVYLNKHGCHFYVMIVRINSYACSFHEAVELLWGIQDNEEMIRKLLIDHQEYFIEKVLRNSKSYIKRNITTDNLDLVVA